MKNRKITIILLILVLVIWGVVIFRIILNKPSQVIIHKELPDSIHSINSEFLRFAYDSTLIDPFLNQTHFKSTEVRKFNVIKGNVRSKSKEFLKVEAFPNIMFYGLISNSESGKKIAIISVNNVKHIIEEGSILMGLIFREFNKDSILVVGTVSSSFIIKKKS